MLNFQVSNLAHSFGAQVTKDSSDRGSHDLVGITNYNLQMRMKEEEQNATIGATVPPELILYALSGDVVKMSDLLSKRPMVFFLGSAGDPVFDLLA